MLAPSLLPTLAISALALAHTAAAYQYTVRPNHSLSYSLPAELTPPPARQLPTSLARSSDSFNPRTSNPISLPPSSPLDRTQVGVGKNEVTGDPGIGFDPSRTVIADQSVSNTIQFSFLEGIHRVVQVSAQDPCAFAGGFDSGVLSVPNGTLQGQGPTATFNVQNNSDVL